jgi:hypothetical protein
MNWNKLITTGNLSRLAALIITGCLATGGFILPVQGQPVQNAVTASPGPTDVEAALTTPARHLDLERSGETHVLKAAQPFTDDFSRDRSLALISKHPLAAEPSGCAFDLRAGYGQFSQVKDIVCHRTSGAGVVQPSWLYLKVCFAF